MSHLKKKSRHCITVRFFAFASMTLWRESWRGCLALLSIDNSCKSVTVLWPSTWIIYLWLVGSHLWSSWPLHNAHVNSNSQSSTCRRCLGKGLGKFTKTDSTPLYTLIIHMRALYRDNNNVTLKMYPIATNDIILALWRRELWRIVTEVVESAQLWIFYNLCKNNSSDHFQLAKFYSGTTASFFRRKYFFFPYVG